MKDRDFQNSFKDNVIRCVDCGDDFVFSAGEQAFFASKRPPLTPPKRCSACRAFRKRTINPSVPYDSAGHKGYF